MNEEHSPHVKLALQTINEYVRTGTILDVRSEAPDELLGSSAGVFVSLHKHGELRGCIGTIEATTSSIAEEIINNAISAAARDWRFQPVEPDELADLECSVDVLGAAEPVTDISEMDPKVYGVIVRRGSRKGLLLPDLDGVDSVQHQIAIALRKAGIGEEESYELFRFKVTRYH